LKLSFRPIVANPRRFRIFSLLILVLILGLESIAVDQLSTTLPAPVSVENSRVILQSLIAFDGVLVGFGAIVFASLLGRATAFQEISYVMLSMIATVALYMISVMNALYGLALSTNGLSANVITGPWGLTIYATTVLFFTVYIHMARTYIVGKVSS
jgi:hypothetical protein